MRKKKAALLLAIAMCLNMTACSINSSDTAKNETVKPATSSDATVEAENTDAEAPNAKGTDAEVADSEGTDSEATDAQATDSEVTDSEATDAQATDSEGTDSEATDAQATDSEVTDARTTDAEVTDSELTDAELTDAELTDTELTDSEPADSVEDESDDEDSSGLMYTDEIGTHVDPLEVVVESDSAKESNTSAGSYLTVESTNNGLTLILSGLTEANKDATVEAIWSNYDILEIHPLKIINEAYVDAEKSTIQLFLPYDNNHCWAGSAANMLWLSGWANESGGNEQSVDEIMTFFGESFTNRGYSQDSGIAFYMNNQIFGLHTDAAERKDGAEGHHSKMMIEKLITQTNLINSLEGINELLKLSEQSIGLSISDTFLGDVFTEGGHALTIVGVIYDSLAESPEEMFKAIIYADTDNDTGYDYTDDSMEEKIPKETEASRTSKVNSYTVNKITPWTSNDGSVYWSMNGWEQNPSVLTYLYSLPYATEENKEAITDSHGTGNNTTEIDLTGGAVWINTPSVEAAGEVYSSDQVTLALAMFNRTDHAETNVNVALKVDLCDSNNKVIKSQVYYQTYDFPVYHLGDNPVYFTADITDLLSGISGGEIYTVVAHLNPPEADGVPEAYYLNNDYIFNDCSFYYYK